MLTSTVISAILILICLFLFVFLCLKGVNPVMIGLLCGAIMSVVCLSGFTTGLFTTFISGISGTVASTLFPFMSGAFVGGMMSVSGCSTTMGNLLMKRTSRKAAPWIIIIFTCIMNLTGMSSTMYVVAAFAIAVLRAADMPLEIGLICAGGFNMIIAWAMPGFIGFTNSVLCMVYGTNTFAGMGVAIPMTIVGIALTLGYLFYIMKKYEKEGRHFEDSPTLPKMQELKDGEGPSPALGFASIVIVIAVAMFLQYGIKLSASNAVVIGQTVGGLFILVTCGKYIQGNKLGHITESIQRAFVPVIAMGFVTGFANVVADTNAYQAIMTAFANMNLNPYVGVVLVTSVIVALCANGISCVMILMQNGITQQFMVEGVNFGVLHALTRTTCACLDTLPHSANVILNLSCFGLDYKKGYKHCFMTTVLIPLVMVIVGLIIAVIFY